MMYLESNGKVALKEGFSLNNDGKPIDQIG